jgi:hypothetical protein
MTTNKLNKIISNAPEPNTSLVFVVASARWYIDDIFCVEQPNNLAGTHNHARALSILH